jgi:hypothetical protein
MKKLASFYLGYGAAVGGGLFLLALVGTQAAHSAADAISAVLLGLVAPLPMLLPGVALWRGWKAAPIPCIVVPVVMTIGLARVWGRPQPTYFDGALAGFVFNAQYRQLYFLPGAIVGLLGMGRVMWAGRRRDAEVGDDRSAAG